LPCSKVYVGLAIFVAYSAGMGNFSPGGPLFYRV